MAGPSADFAAVACVSAATLNEILRVLHRRGVLPRELPKVSDFLRFSDIGPIFVDAPRLSFQAAPPHLRATIDVATPLSDDSVRRTVALRMVVLFDVDVNVSTPAIASRTEPTPSVAFGLPLVRVDVTDAAVIDGPPDEQVQALLSGPAVEEFLKDALLDAVAGSSPEAEDTAPLFRALQAAGVKLAALTITTRGQSLLAGVDVAERARGVPGLLTDLTPMGGLAVTFDAGFVASVIEHVGAALEFEGGSVRIERANCGEGYIYLQGRGASAGFEATFRARASVRLSPTSIGVDVHDVELDRSAGANAIEALSWLGGPSLGTALTSALEVLWGGAHAEATRARSLPITLPRSIEFDLPGGDAVDAQLYIDRVSIRGYGIDVIGSFGADQPRRASVVGLRTADSIPSRVRYYLDPGERFMVDDPRVSVAWRFWRKDTMAIVKDFTGRYVDDGAAIFLPTGEHPDVYRYLVSCAATRRTATSEDTLFSDLFELTIRQPTPPRGRRPPR